MHHATPSGKSLARFTLQPDNDPKHIASVVKAYLDRDTRWNTIRHGLPHPLPPAKNSTLLKLCEIFFIENNENGGQLPMKSVGLFLKKKWQESLPKRFQVLLKNQGFIPNTHPRAQQNYANSVLAYIFHLCLDVSVTHFTCFLFSLCLKTRKTLITIILL